MKVELLDLQTIQATSKKITLGNRKDFKKEMKFDVVCNKGGQYESNS